MAGLGGGDAAATPGPATTTTAVATRSGHIWLAPTARVPVSTGKGTGNLTASLAARTGNLLRLGLWARDRMAAAQAGNGIVRGLA